MAFLIGALLALAVGHLCMKAGFNRDRALYPTMTIVVASYYVLFAAMGASTHSLLVESLCSAVFVVGATLGFKFSLWIVVDALALHGLFDLLHAEVIYNAGVPAWWPAFCLAFDLVAAGYLAALLKSRRIPVHIPPT